MGVYGTPCTTLLPTNTREGVRGGPRVAIGDTRGLERERDVRERGVEEREGG